MATIKPHQVRESLEELRAIERHHRKTPCEMRIRLLRCIKENKFQTFADFAAKIGYSQTTVKRWWAVYRTRGIDALLAMRDVKRPKSSDAELMKDLQQKLNANTIVSLDDLRRWLDTKTAVHEAEQSSRNVSRRAVRSSASFQPHLPENVVRFLNELPMDSETDKWGRAFYRALSLLLGDVDRIIIAFNLECDLQHPEHYEPERHITQTLPTERQVQDDVMARSVKGSSWSEDVLSRMEKSKFPFDHYHPPYVFDYYFRGAYLGTMLLLNERLKITISEETLGQVEELRRFMEFAFVTCIARHQLAHPEVHVFNNRLREIIIEHNLSEPERDVLTLQLTGKSYNRIAASMDITLDTVRTHVRSLHKKTGVRNILELFARYFTPLITPADNR